QRKNALVMAENSPVTLLLPFAVRRIASEATPDALNLVLASFERGKIDAGMLMREMQLGLKGRPQVKMPKEWPAFFDKAVAAPSAEVRNQAIALGARFGDLAAFDKLRAIVVNASLDVTQR